MLPMLRLCSMKSDTEQWAGKDKTVCSFQSWKHSGAMLISRWRAISRAFQLWRFPVSDAETPALKRNRLLFVLVCARLDDLEDPGRLLYSSHRSTSISPIPLSTS